MARREGWLVAELAALTGFVVVRPVLESFGQSPEAFLTRGASGSDVVVFALIVAVVPLVALSAIGALTGLLGPRLRQAVHLATIGVLAALGTLQVVPIDGRSLLLGVAVVIGVAVAALRWRVEAARSFLRFAGLGTLVFVVQFLVMSPASSLMGGRSGGADAEVAAAVHAAVGDDAPPVVMVVMDALPTVSLLDGTGHIDAELYPNIARLAGDSTWYRNHTTVAPVTLQALPAILTGTVPDPATRSAVLRNYPRNLFTLLGGTYDLHVHEQVTGLCPEGLCPESDDGELGPLLGDAEELWGYTVEPPEFRQLLPGAFDQRFRRTADWIDAQDFREGPTPDLFFQHMMLPHGEWQYLPDGSSYGRPGAPTDSAADAWGTFGQEVGAQRDVLQTQAVDTLIGRLLDRLEAAGTYDDALIVLTADHGAAFAPGAHLRALDAANYEQIMWSPLIVKAPGQRRGAIDDGNVENIDILPIIADQLGIDLDRIESDDGTPWEVDGVVPGQGPARSPADKRILDMANGDLEANAPHHMVRVDGREGFAKVLATDLVEGSGPDAVWRRTRYGGLVGDDVDDLTVADPADSEMQVDDLDRWDDVDIDRPRIETRALGWVDGDAAVAVVLNGRVAAVAPPRPTPYGVSVIHALLDPETLVDGHNDYALYLVDGPADAPVLHPMPLTPAP
ncbi:MAG TPA: sulfatase-like hydrolase/transferase [Acidimicrobiales bacterium]|nr:sulfatase-like hydrolase/transferase [Acidimicrobiales bacterium]